MDSYLTFINFLKNPMGAGSSFGSRRDLMINEMTQLFQNSYVKNKRYYKFECFKNKSEYYIMMQIPSDKYPEKLQYDVVLQFIPHDKANEAEMTINNYEMYVFTNAMNFTYTYAYVFNKNRYLIKFLRNKVPNIALTTPPSKKNPQESAGFEKSIYYALLFMKEFRFNTKAGLICKRPFSKTYITNNVRDCQDTIDLFEEIKNQERANKKMKEFGKEKPKKTKSSLKNTM